MKSLNLQRLLFVFVSTIFLVNSACSKISKDLGLTDGSSTSPGLVKIDGPSTASLSDCVPLVLSVVDTAGNPKSVAKDSSFTLSATNGGQFFEAADCSGSAVSTITRSVATAAASLVYFRGSLAGSSAIVMGLDAVTIPGNLNIRLTDSESGQTIGVEGSSVLPLGRCEPYIINLKNSSGQSTRAKSDITLNLSGAAPGVIYSGATCTGSPISSVTIATNSTHAVVYLMSSSMAKVIFQAEPSITAILPALFPVEFKPTSVSLATQLTMSGPPVVTAGVCSAPFFVKTLDAFGNQAAVVANTSVSLTSSMTGTFYTDASCSQGASGSVMVNSNTSGQSFYFMASGAGSVNLTADDSGSLLPASLAIAAMGSGQIVPVSISLTGPATVTAGTCSSAFVVKTLDGSNTATGVAGSTTVNLTGAGSGSFYSDSSCASAVTSLVFAVGEHTKNVYYRNNSAQSLTLNADDTGSLLAGSTPITVSAGAAAKISLSGVGSLNINECRSYVAQVRDANNNPTAVTMATNLSLTSTGTGLFFSDSGCSTAVTDVMVNSGANSTIFYFKSMDSGAQTITADDPGSLTAGTENLTINALPAVKLVLAASAQEAGQCRSAQVGLKNSIDGHVVATSAVSVNLGGQSTGKFYSDVACTMEISTTTIATNTSSTTYYYKNNSSGSTNFTVASAGLTSAAVGVTIVPGPSDHLDITGLVNIAAGSCAAYTVTAKDAFNNASPVSGAAIVNLTGAGSGAFYSDVSCATSVGSRIIDPGQSAFTFYYRNTTAGSRTLTATHTGSMTAGTKSITLADGGPAHLRLTGPATASAGSCSTLTLQVVDALSNPSNVSTNTSVTLSGKGSGNFYGSADCTTGGSISTITVASGSNSATVYYTNAVAESVSLLAAFSGLSTGQLDQVRTAGLPTKIVLTGPAAMQVGSCTGYQLRTLDSLDNSSAVSAATLINFSALGSGKIYSDEACATQVSSVTLSAGSSSKNVFFRNTVAESITANADDTGSLTAGTLAIQTQSMPASELVFLGASTQAAQACGAFTVRSRDSMGNSAVVPSSVSITLTGKGSGEFYSNATCTTVLTAPTLGAGSSDMTIYYANSKAENLTLSAAAMGFNTGVRTLSVTGLTPTKLTLSGVTSISAGVCAAYQLQIQDTLSNPSPTSADRTINLTGQGAFGAFYSDASCGSGIGSVTLTSTQPTRVVYFKAVDAQTTSLTASDTGLPALTGASLSVAVAAASSSGPVKLMILGASSAPISSCSAFMVQTQDTLNNGANVTSMTIVNLAGAGAGKFYSDSACTTEATTVSLASGENSKYYYFKTATAGSYLFNVTATGLTANVRSVVVESQTVIGGGGGSTTTPPPNLVPVKLIVNGPGEVLSGTCGGQYTVKSADSADVITPVLSSTVVTLTDGAGNGTFYSSSTCATPITSVTLAAGASEQTFYYKNSQAESVSVQAYSSQLIYGTMSVQVRQSALLELRTVSAGTEIWSNFIYRSKGTLSDYQVILRNVGLTQATSVNLSLPSMTTPFTFRGGTYPGLGGTCSNGMTLLPNEQCSMIVRFQPTAATSFADNLKITYTEGSNSREANLPLTGQANTTLKPVRLATGSNHTCVSASDMSSRCFGNNASGQLGLGDTVNYGSAAYSMENLTWTPFSHFATQIVAGESHTCSLLPNGEVLCWGDNTYGQLGRGVTSANFGAAPSDLAAANTLVNLGTGRTATKISSGANHVCALLDNATVKCWGRNDYGQLGLENNISRGRAGADMGDSLPVVSLGVGQNVIDISAGANHTCAILQGGQIKCWGRNIYGQLGIGSTADRGDHPGEMGTNLPNVSLGSGATVLQVAAGADHTCAIITLPTLIDPLTRCWGRNDSGQLGIGDAIHRGTSPSHMGDNMATTDMGLSGVPKQLSLGRAHSCLLLETGAVKCWGANSYGQLGQNHVNPIGDGANEMGNNLNTISLGTEVLARQIASGADHVCALLDTDDVKCWGRNHLGQLGHNENPPVDLWGSNSGSRAMASLPKTYVRDYTFSYYEGLAMDRAYTCAISRTENEVVCWGRNSSSGLKHGYQFINFASVGGVADLQAGTGFVCALAKNGSVHCWGGTAWRTGTPTATYSYAPPNLASPLATGIAQIAVGESHLCTRTAAGVVACRGTNTGYVLGASNPNMSSNTPATITITGGAKSIASGASHACAISGADTLYCWGSNFWGQVGDGTTTDRNTPTLITTGSTVAQVELGRRHSCVILTSGDVKCWGDDDFGAVGRGVGSGRVLAPTAVSLGTGVTATALDAGEASTCAVTNLNKLKCWGRNQKGQLGLGSTVDKTTPQDVQLGTDFRIFKISSPLRGFHRCAIGYEAVYHVPYQLKCWGDNSDGQLGYGDLADRGGASQWTARALLPVPQNERTALVAFTETEEGFRAFPSSPSTIEFDPLAMTYSQLDLNPTGSLNLFERVWDQMALDSGYTCAYEKINKQVLCWGQNATSGESYPRKMHDFSSVSGVLQLTSGAGFMCALAGNNSVYCWGSNTWNGTQSSSTTVSYGVPNLSSPVASSVAEIAAGESHLCWRTTANAIQCMGYNVATVLGSSNPYTYISSGSPVSISVTGTAAKISSGASHACYVNTSGALYCWGSNFWGQIGDGTTTRRATPVQVLASGVSSVGLGRTHSCAILTTGALQCWGDDSYGQVGRGTGSGQANSPVTISLGGTSVRSLDLADGSTCAVLTDNTMRCWGRNDKGQLGLGNTTNANTPQTVNLGTGFAVDIARSPRYGYHRCAIGTQNSYNVMKCWGENDLGQLGYADTTQRANDASWTRTAIVPAAYVQRSAVSAFNVSDLVNRITSALLVSNTPTTSSGTSISTYGAYPTGGFVRFKLWGGGGGGGTAYQAGYYGGSAGSGGYVVADVAGNLITSSLTYYVGGGGIGYGSQMYYGGTGGSASAVKVGSTLIAVAGGGGGGGGAYSSYHGGYGGGAGQAGIVYYAGTPGGAGTTSGPGAGGTGQYSGYAGSGTAGGAGDAVMGSALCNAASSAGYGLGGCSGLGGGGGGGYFGGGSGGGYWGASYYSGHGGGGGSNYVNTAIATQTTNSLGTNGTMTCGTIAAPGNADADFAGNAGYGGMSGGSPCGYSNNGYAGRAVFRYYDP